MSHKPHNAIIVLGLVLLSWHTESSALLHSLKTFTLEELIPLRANFFPDRLSIQWISDTEYIYREGGVGLRKYNAFTDTHQTILSEADLYNLKSFSVSSFSADGKYILLSKNKNKVYRYSSVAEYAVFNLETGTIKEIGPGLLQAVVWSNAGSLAYVQDNNVYYVADVDNPVGRALTTRGVPGEVYFGVTDWIYEEEVFNAAEALWFSPGGTYLAVASFNDTNVESVTYPFYGNALDVYNQYPELVQFKYPKVGRTNPNVGLQVFKVGDANNEPWNIPASVDVVGMDHILGKVNWASDRNLIVLWLNRRQNVSILVNCDLKKDKCSIVKEQTEPNGWIDIGEAPFFDKTGTKMVEIEPLYNGDQRFPHAARVDFDTLTIEDLSPGNGTVTKILGWNEDTDTVFYIVSPGNSPWLRQLWSTCGGIVRCVTCKEPSCRFVSAMFAPRAKYAVITCSACNIPPKIFLYNSQTDGLKLINDNSRLSDKLKQYKLPMTLFNVLSIGDDLMAHVKLTLPPEVIPGHKYPMIVRVYSGPGTTRVKDNFDLEYYNTYLSVNRSVIVGSIDVRGSGVMGMEALHAVNNALGTVEISDTLQTIKSLATLYNFIDPERIGVWGWSYGGFASTMMLVQDEQNILACGAAVAPVTNWLNYDSIYTERYMGTLETNSEGYLQADLTAQVETIRGRKYLLVHGTGDDNVHFQNSLLLAKQLQHADIDFQQISYTDEDHSLFGVSRHFYHALDRFWTECLRI